MAKKAKMQQKPVEIVMDGADDSVVEQVKQSIPHIVAAAAPTTITTTQTVTTSVVPKLVQKVDWRYLAQGDNFKRLVTMSNMNREAVYLNFNARQYEQETGERLDKKSTKGALTFETPYMKCVLGMHDSDQYPGSFSMRLSTDNVDADPEVEDFAEFMDRTVDETLRKEIVQRAFGWMKDVPSMAKHDIVTKHRETTNKVYKGVWEDGSYTQDQYEADVEECIETCLRTMGDGGGSPMLHLKGYPVKNGKVLVEPTRPDILILNSKNEEVPYEGCPVAENGKTYVKAVFSVNRISFTKEKFYITPVCRLLKFKTLEEVEEEEAQNAGGRREVSYTFDDNDAPVTIDMTRGSNAAAADDAE